MLRWFRWQLVAGPATFVAAWVVGGARTPGYSYVHDAISRTAAAGAPQRHLMTAGFVAYAIGAGALIAAALAASSLVDDHVGLAQRVGLTTGDLWLAAAGVVIASRHPHR